MPPGGTLHRKQQRAALDFPAEPRGALRHRRPQRPGRARRGVPAALSAGEPAQPSEPEGVGVFGDGLRPEQPEWAGVDKAVVRLPDELSRDEEAPLSAVTGHPGTTAFLRQRHPFVREYYIDRETGVLLGFRKFSASGKLLSARNLGQVEFQPDWTMLPGIFDTPAKVVAEVDDTASFRAWLAGNVQKKRWKRHRRNAWSGNPQIWAYILAFVGGACLAGGWWLRRRQR